MSIEADLESFRELALEEQDKIPFYLRTTGDADPLIQNLDPILDELIGEHKVAVNGEVFLPDVDDFGRVLGIEHYPHSDSPVIGKSNGVLVVKRSFFDERFGEGYYVGYQIELTQAKRITPVETTFTQLYGFAPIESSNLYVPSLLISEAEVLPADDDIIAGFIDEAVLNDPKNFSRLAQIFNQLEEGHNGAELKIDYYLKYLNRIFPLSEYIANLVARDVYSEEANSLISVVEEGNTAEITMEAQRFTFIPQIGGLCLRAQIDQTEAYQVPLLGLVKLSFKRSVT